MVLTTCLEGAVAGWPGGWGALEEWKLRLTSAKVEVEVEAELGNKLQLTQAMTMKWPSTIHDCLEHFLNIKIHFGGSIYQHLVCTLLQTTLTGNFFKWNCDLALYKIFIPVIHNYEVWRSNYVVQSLSWGFQTELNIHSNSHWLLLCIVCRDI